MYLIFRFMTFNEQFEDLFRTFQDKHDLRPGFQGDYDLRTLFGDLVDDPSFVRDRVSLFTIFFTWFNDLIYPILALSINYGHSWSVVSWARSTCSQRFLLYEVRSGYSNWSSDEPCQDWSCNSFCGTIVDTFALSRRLWVVKSSDHIWYVSNISFDYKLIWFYSPYKVTQIRLSTIFCPNVFRSFRSSLVAVRFPWCTLRWNMQDRSECQHFLRSLILYWHLILIRYSRRSNWRKDLASHHCAIVSWCQGLESLCMRVE